MKRLRQWAARLFKGPEEEIPEGLKKFIVKITGTAWLKSETIIVAANKPMAEQQARERFDDLEWEIVELDPPVITEARAMEIEKATNICRS